MDELNISYYFSGIIVHCVVSFDATEKLSQLLIYRRAIIMIYVLLLIATQPD